MLSANVQVQHESDPCKKNVLGGEASGNPDAVFSFDRLHQNRGETSAPETARPTMILVHTGHRSVNDGSK